MTFLAKIQKTEFIEDMYMNEYIYFSVFDDFRKSINTDTSGRFDPREGNLLNKQIKYLALKVNDKRIEISRNALEFKGQYMEYLRKPRMNICSLFKLVFDDAFNLIPFSDSLEELGGKALVIFNLIKFFEILDTQLESLGYEYSRRTVTYYDSEYTDGNIDLHHKDHMYEFQQEYRILIAPAGLSGIKVPVPGLQEVSNVLNTNLLKDLKIVPIPTDQ
jgi:hypothetical protein